MADVAEIAALLMRYRASIYAHLLAAVRNPHDAEDLLQEVAVAATASADRFESGSNFAAWVREISRRRLLEFSRERHPETSAQPEAIEALEAAAARLDAEPEDRRGDALRRCLEDLSPASRRILDLRYRENRDVAGIAAAVGRSVQGTYALLKRVRITLRDCAERALGTTP